MSGDRRVFDDAVDDDMTPRALSVPRKQLLAYLEAGESSKLVGIHAALSQGLRGFFNLFRGTCWIDWRCDAGVKQFLG